MAAEIKPCADIGDAMRKMNALMKYARQLGCDVLGIDVGPHLNPGDVYDAYEAIERSPVLSDTLEQHQCGPFAAVFLYQKSEQDPSVWRDYVKEMYDDRYVSGFYHGFGLIVPDPEGECDAYYLRGVYDGVMAHAAVF